MIRGEKNGGAEQGTSIPLPPTPTTNPRELYEKVNKVARSSRISNKVTPDLARLNLANLSLHGREDDIKLLRNKLREFTKCTKERQPELLLVAGGSGTGKSVLVKKGLEEPAQKLGILFAGGKFDLNKSGAQPLSAFVSAMASLIRYVMGTKDAGKIKASIKDTLDVENMVLLAGVLPVCKHIFSYESVVRRQSSIDEREVESRRQSFTSGKDALMRQRYAIRQLLKAICINLKGLVLFIDDLQWSDHATIELIKSIVMDNDIPSLLVVGAYRADEVSEQIKDDNDSGVAITTIQLDNLCLDSVKALVAEALRMDIDAIIPLATTVYKKTRGNAFYVLVFLKSLYEEELLQYNFGVMTWTWDSNDVNAKLVTENVATMLLSKLKRFNKSSRMLLTIAASLGASFSASTVTTIAENLSSRDISDATETAPSDVGEFAGLIEELESEGLLDRDVDSPDSSAKYRFSHDQVQSAAIQLIPNLDERNSFRGEMGDILMDKMDSEDLEDNLFVVAGLRNCAIASMCGTERQELAKMNLKAGLKASKNAAFDTAVVFYRTGRTLLGEKGWETDANTMLQLCSEEATASFINGDLTTMNQLIDEVLSKDLSIEEKFKVFEVKILAANASSKFDESITTAIKVRRQLGLPSPANKPASKLTVIKDFIKTDRLLGKRTAEEIANLHSLKDERIILGQRMLEFLCTSTHQAQPTIFPLIVMLMVRTSVKHGVNESSCDAFTGYGIVLCALGRLKRGREMADAVQLLLSNPTMNMQRMKSRSSFVIENMIMHWTGPVQASLEPLLSGYLLGLEMGDLESASFNLGARCFHLWYSSRPLAGILQEIETDTAVLAKLNQPTVRYFVLPYLLAVKKLRGLSTEMDFDDLLTIASKLDNKPIRAYTTTVQLELLVMFQDWDAALALLLNVRGVQDDIVAFYASARFTVLDALVYLKVAQVTKSWLARKK